MKNSLKRLTAAGCLMASALTANANIIVNGSFEDHAPFQNGSWGLYASIPGWTATGQHPIEIGTAGTYGVTGQDGQDVMELDSTGNAIVAQMLTSPGSYILSFLYAQRSGVSSTSGSFDVYWNNALVSSFAPTSTAMVLFTSSALVATGSDILEFKGTGTNDSYGALIDNVQLNRLIIDTEQNPVPDAASTLALLGGALGLLGFAARRRN